MRVCRGFSVGGVVSVGLGGGGLVKEICFLLQFSFSVI